MSEKFNCHVLVLFQDKTFPNLATLMKYFAKSQEKEIHLTPVVCQEPEGMLNKSFNTSLLQLWILHRFNDLYFLLRYQQYSYHKSFWAYKQTFSRMISIHFIKDLITFFLDDLQGVVILLG